RPPPSRKEQTTRGDAGRGWERPAHRPGVAARLCRFFLGPLVSLHAPLQDSAGEAGLEARLDPERLGLDRIECYTVEAALLGRVSLCRHWLPFTADPVEKLPRCRRATLSAAGVVVPPDLHRRDGRRL